MFSCKYSPASLILAISFHLWSTKHRLESKNIYSAAQVFETSKWQKPNKFRDVGEFIFSWQQNLNDDLLTRCCLYHAIPCTKFQLKFLSTDIATDLR